MSNQRPPTKPLRRKNTLGLNAIIDQYGKSGDLVKFLPPQFAHYVLNLPDEFVNLPEDELRTAIRKNLNKPDWEPSPTLEALRNSFWVEHANAVQNNRAVNEAAVRQGMLTELAFILFYKRPVSLAWMICPPIDYVNHMEALLSMGLRRLRDVLSMEIKDDPKVAETLLKTVMMLDMRIKGGYTQRSEQKIQTQVVPAITHTPENEKDLKDLDARIKELETKTVQAVISHKPRDGLLGLTEAMDAEVVSVPPKNSKD